MSENKIILYTSDEAAAYQTGLRGWVSRTGYFFGDNKDSEKLARYSGCTHVLCQHCGKPTPKAWSACRECRDRQRKEKYLEMPAKKWDGETPLYSEYNGKFYGDIAIAQEDAYDDQIGLDDMMLIICDPVYLSPICEDLWGDELPEDGELPDRIRKALNEFNRILKDFGPVSWQPGKFRVDISQENDKSLT